MPDKPDADDYKLHHPENYYIRLLLDKVKLGEIMTPDVVTIKVDAPFSQAARLLMGKSLRHLPVINSEEKLVGLLTQRDLYKIQSPVHEQEDGTWHYNDESLNQIVLSHVMIPEPYALYEDTPVGQALVKMVHSKFGCIPIIGKQAHLKGIITQWDILHLAARIYTE